MRKFEPRKSQWKDDLTVSRASKVYETHRSKSHPPRPPFAPCNPTQAKVQIATNIIDWAPLRSTDKVKNGKRFYIPEMKFINSPYGAAEQFERIQRIKSKTKWVSSKPFSPPAPAQAKATIE